MKTENFILTQKYFKHNLNYFFICEIFIKNVYLFFILNKKINEMNVIIEIINMYKQQRK